MTKLKFKGNDINIKGNVPQKGDKAPDFRFVKNDMSEGSLYETGQKKKVIIAVPSLDTGVCQIEAKQFNDRLADRDDVIGLVVSKDLPFAQKRYFEEASLKNVIGASDFRGNFTQDFNTEIQDGPVKGLSARAVFVVDENNTVQYSQLVPEVTDEPDYDAAIKAIDDLK